MPGTGAPPSTRLPPRVEAQRFSGNSWSAQGIGCKTDNTHEILGFASFLAIFFNHSKVDVFHLDHLSDNTSKLDSGVDLSKEGVSRSTGIEKGFGKTVLWSSAGKEVFSLLEVCWKLGWERRLAARTARLGLAGIAGLRGERGLEEELSV